MINKILALALISCLLLPLPSLGKQAEMIAGAAASTEITALFFEEFRHNFACAEYDFKVMTTPIRHKSGVLTTNRFIFGRTANPLDEKERKLGKDEILLGNVPIIIATGLETGVKSLTLKQLRDIYTGKVNNWKDVGGNDAQIVLIGKDKSDPLFTSLEDVYPFFKNVKYDKIIKYDNETSRFLKTPNGGHAIAFGAKSNFDHYNHMHVIDFSAHISVGLAYDKKNEHLPVVKAAKVYASSPEWKDLLKKIDAFPIE